MTTKSTHSKEVAPMTRSPLFSSARRCAGLLAVATALTALLVLAPAASADHSFCPGGTEPGHCFNPEGIAVDEASGNVYVADRGNDRVNVFAPDGSFLFDFSGFERPVGLAIDNDPASASYRDVYVGTPGFQVQKFDREGNFLFAFGSKGNGPGQFSGTSDPIAVGPGGVVYVGDSVSLGADNYEPRVEKFDPATGSLLGACKLPVLDPHQVPLTSLAIDSGGDVYAVLGAEGLRKFSWAEPNCAELPFAAAEPGIEPSRSAIAVDDEDHLFAFQQNKDFRFVTEYDATGAKLKRFGYGEVEAIMHGLAINNVTGDIYGSENFISLVSSKVRHLTLPPPGPIAAFAEAQTGNTKATLEAQVNPEGKETTYHFEYVDQESFESEGGFSGPNVKSTAESASIGSDFDLHPVSGQIGCTEPQSPPQASCLTPETIYRFRIVVKNADGENEAEGSFETKAPLEVGESWASEVGTDGARLNAEVNPLGIPASGYFEYVDQATYEADVEASGPGHGFDHAAQAPAVGAGEGALSFGAGNALTTRAAQLFSLAPGTAYRYRLVASDPFASRLSAEHTFTTFTPAQANTGCPNQEFRTGASAALPDCRAYEIVSPVDKNGGDIAVLIDSDNDPASLNQSASAGGKLAYSSYRAFGDSQSAPYIAQYIATRGADGWSNQAVSPPRGLPVLGQPDLLDKQFAAFSPDLCSGWLRTDSEPLLAEGAIAGYFNFYRADYCGAGGYEALTTVKPPTQPAKEYRLYLQGLSADGATAVFTANDKLTANAIAGTNLLYESSGGALRLVCVLPNSTASKEGCSAGTAGRGSSLRGRYESASHAVSDDGSRIFWTAKERGPGQIYARIDHKETVAVGNGYFQAAATDGSRAIYTTGVEADLYQQKASLNEFDLEAKATHPIAARVGGVLGTSDDLSRIYFASAELLAPGAVEGKPNLYLYERDGAGGVGSYAFVATLTGGDLLRAANAPFDPRSINHNSRVSADGLHAAFVSLASPTGYDNKEVKSGEPAREVYLYDAASEALYCASCNPSGGRPQGREVIRNLADEPLMTAAQIPGAESDLYFQRVLSADGKRLFFESYDALVPRDGNGKVDVYEWEAPGSGDCEEGSPAFSRFNGGCVSLISSGQSGEDTEFVDASESGDDVFLRTNQSLLVQDDGLYDIYDARVLGGYPPPPPPPPPCEGDACQLAPSPPNDPTPASSAFRGPGNPSKARCAKGKTRRKGRCVAKHRKHHKRAKHERRAGR